METKDLASEIALMREKIKERESKLTESAHTLGSMLEDLKRVSKGLI